MAVFMQEAVGEEREDIGTTWKRAFEIMPRKVNFDFHILEFVRTIAFLVLNR